MRHTNLVVVLASRDFQEQEHTRTYDSHKYCRESGGPNDAQSFLSFLFLYSRSSLFLQSFAVRPILGSFPFLSLFVIPIFVWRDW